MAWVKKKIKRNMRISKRGVSCEFYSTASRHIDRYKFNLYMFTIVSYDELEKNIPQINKKLNEFGTILS